MKWGLELNFRGEVLIYFYIVMLWILIPTSVTMTVLCHKYATQGFPTWCPTYPPRTSQSHHLLKILSAIPKTSFSVREQIWVMIVETRFPWCGADALGMDETVTYQSRGDC